MEVTQKRTMQQHCAVFLPFFVLRLFLALQFKIFNQLAQISILSVFAPQLSGVTPYLAQ